MSEKDGTGPIDAKTFFAEMDKRPSDSNAEPIPYTLIGGPKRNRDRNQMMTEDQSFINQLRRRIQEENARLKAAKTQE